MYKRYLEVDCILLSSFFFFFISLSQSVFDSSLSLSFPFLHSQIFFRLILLWEGDNQRRQQVIPTKIITNQTELIIHEIFGLFCNLTWVMQTIYFVNNLNLARLKVVTDKSRCCSCYAFFCYSNQGCITMIARPSFFPRRIIWKIRKMHVLEVFSCVTQIFGAP